MKRGKSFKILSIVALFVAIAGLTVAYAAMSETLKITGSASFESATWKIRFTNLTADKTGGASYEQPILSDTELSNFHVTLTKPGDSVTFTFDVENAGNIDAILTTLTKGEAVCTGTGSTATVDADLVCKNLTYKLQYPDGTNVANNDLLDAGSSKTMNLTLTYKSTASAMPTNKVEITGLDLTMIYSQN